MQTEDFDTVKARVALFGANGMLGRYIREHFVQKTYWVNSYSRKHLNVAYADKYLLFPLLEKLDYVVNCAGVIKPRVKEVGIEQTIRVNSMFPHVLADVCEELNIPLIHITTDCVFSGEDGYYLESDIHDPLDDYGKSKSLGEPSNCCVIRTSIIGEEVGQKRSLLEWVKSQKGGECNGYANHWWNGVTCLQLAKVIEQMVRENSGWEGTRHIYSPDDVSKYQLLEMINRVYDLNIQVNEVMGDSYCNRILRTYNHEELNRFKIPSLKHQLSELRQFKL